ncbi:DUF1127 domain-containing protein [Martelella alba]|uniref:DUF1127 domain-containing protein n=2 Tax=Martelella alba TaxID=2590451 RepID=A0ABY2SI62_9HYPH|nr:DUF1127 domain-containing protein [Martelella alba]
MKAITRAYPTTPVFTLPGLRLSIPALSGVFRRLEAWRRRRINRAILLQLNDDQLRDIGLNREDIRLGRNID